MFLFKPWLYLGMFDFPLAIVIPLIIERTEINILRVITVKRRETCHRNFVFIFRYYFIAKIIFFVYQ